MKLLGLLIVWIIKGFLCKGFAIGLILFLMWCKGRSFHFDSDCWTAYFLQCSKQKLFCIMTSVYVCAAGLSTLLCYFLLTGFHYPYASAIAWTMFLVGAILTCYRYQHGGKQKITQRYTALMQQLVQEKKEL